MQKKMKLIRVYAVELRILFAAKMKLTRVYAVELRILFAAKMKLTRVYAVEIVSGKFELVSCYKCKPTA